MQNSKVIEHHGIFLGAALCLPDDLGWRFVAADDRVVLVNGKIGATFGDVQAMVRNAFLSSGTILPAMLPLHQNNMPALADAAA